ncbi:hypothetical protein MACJ_003380 [Theileria orientalis]|uniref:Uncharacterized protein n=1 Tax=Theileria orientalis TaxID=68886 RepID=A0A976XJQ0_THEOR|nr:hypothetical protein MACJ_003380 [Theileria orientalis]
MIAKSGFRFFSTQRHFSVMGRDNADFTSRVLKRITGKHEQKPLGKYPYPPEDEMFWKNRRTAHGGYFQHSISAHQLKFIYPVFHQAPARVWAKISQGFWWVIWPVFMTYAAVEGLYHVNRKYVKRHNYY